MALFGYNISVTGDCSNTNQGAITLELTGGTPPYSVQWITPLEAEYPDIDYPITVTNLDSDTYVVRVNDSTLGQNNEFLINIPVSSGVCASILSVQNAICGADNGIVITSSSSLYSSTEYYLYDTTDTFIASAITNNSQVIFPGLSAGTYYAVVHDLGGCTGKSQNFIVEATTPLDFGLYVVPNAACGSFPIGKLFITGLTGTPPFEYLWSNSQTGDTITGLTSGEYSVQVTDANGCVVSKNATIENIDPIGLGLFTVSAATCFENNGTITLTITGGTEPYFYSASTGEFTISYSKSFTITNLYSGQYNFLVKDAALCSLEVGTSISSPTGIDSITITTENSTCSSDDGSVLTIVNGGTAPFTYTLIDSEGNTTNVTNASSAYQFTNLTSGTYTVAVQDADGCGQTQEVTIIATNKFTINATTTGATCNLNNGVISVVCATGYTLPLDYSLDGEQVIIGTALSAATFTNVAPGQHTVTVTDATGCAQTRQIFVTAGEPLIYSVYVTSCNSGSDGSITTFISSGTPPFTFNWSENIPGNPQNIFVSGLTAGTYSITITDSAGCTQQQDVFIECQENLMTYQTYVMGQQVFNIDSPTKCGILQMFNEGFQDLTSGNTNCSLSSATFTAKVSVNPLGLSTTELIYTSTTLNDVPSDQLWYTTIRTMLYTVPGVGSVVVNPDNNLITIQTLPDSSILNGQQIIVELVINYNITCES
jgi:uncharacterized protein (DUF2141 family)